MAPLDELEDRAAKILARLDELSGGPWRLCPRCVARGLRARGVPEHDITKILAEASGDYGPAG